MKARGILVISLGLNLLLGILVSGLARKHSRPPTLPAVPSAPVAAPKAPDSSSLPDVAAPTAAVPSFHWSRLESEDYRQYVANLRGIGCPELTVRDIVFAELTKHYLGKMQDVQSPPRQPWDNADRRKTISRMRQGQRQTLRREQNDILVELFGPDVEVFRYQRDFSGVHSALGEFEFLSDVKSAHLLSLASDYGDRFGQVRSEANGILIDEDLAKLQQFQREFKTQLERLLTPSELDELTCRAQLDSDVLGDHGLYLHGIILTGAELRRICQMSESVQNIMDTLGQGDPSGPSDEELTRRRENFQEQVAVLLGKGRLADLARAQEEAFREAYEFSQNNHLPRSTAIQVYEARKSAEQEAAQLNADTSLSAEERTAGLLILKNNASRCVSSLLGDANAKKYLSEKGDWLGELAPDPEPAPMQEGAP